MPYHLVPRDRDLETLLRRVAAEELDAALAKLAVAAPPPAAVHGVRKHVKKLRGLLRLLRPGLPVFEAENAALRDAAAHLSARRDADVRLATFDRLAGPDGVPAFAALRDVLRAETGDAAAEADPVPEARAALAAVRARVGSWTVRGRDREVLHEGLARTRRQARRAMAAARAEPGAEAMHDWRKRVKDGWYQARLLTPVRPAVLGPFAEEAGVLGEDLGDHHDLAVLADHLAALPPGPHAAGLPQMLARIGAAQADLEARIFPAGAILLADKPGAVAARWTGWWRDWRG